MLNQGNYKEGGQEVESRRRHTEGSFRIKQETKQNLTPELREPHHNATTLKQIMDTTETMSLTCAHTHPDSLSGHCCVQIDIKDLAVFILF